MEFYHDGLFLDKIVKIALEARKKRRYLTRTDRESYEIGKYEKIEEDLLNLAQFINEDNTDN